VYKNESQYHHHNTVTYEQDYLSDSTSQTVLSTNNYLHNKTRNMQTQLSLHIGCEYGAQASQSINQEIFKVTYPSQ